MRTLHYIPFDVRFSRADASMSRTGEYLDPPFSPSGSLPAREEWTEAEMIQFAERQAAIDWIIVHVLPKVEAACLVLGFLALLTSATLLLPAVQELLS
jgi:hypothetical protein